MNKQDTTIISIYLSRDGPHPENVQLYSCVVVGQERLPREDETALHLLE